MSTALSSFSLNWWYTPRTKLSISFTTTATLTTKTPFNRLDYSTGLNASIEENYKFQNTITSHPVESGTNISDHIIIQPLVISISGLLTAIKVIPLFGEVAPGVLDFYQLGSATKFLIEAANTRQLFTLVTGLYFGQSFFSRKNMAIQDLNIPRNNHFGKTSIKFNITFKELILTSTNPTPDNSSTQAALDPNVGGITI